MEDFWKKLSEAKRRALLSDYDGTLAPFVEDRDEAFPYPGVIERLSAIRQSDTRVVIVTGRSAREILRFLPTDPPLEVWGCHGGERLLPSGELHTLPLTSAQRAALERASEIALALLPERRVEKKPLSVAFHLRGLSYDIGYQLKELLDPLCDCGLGFVPFDGGLELRIPSCTKAMAVETIIAEEGDAAVAYLGDDLTDEDAFSAIKGKGLSALVRREWRPTTADVWIIPPEELLSFLDRWIAASK
jgi:trehalose-phosphatase